MRRFVNSVSGTNFGRAAGAALVASLMAGCSSDSLRLQDGFYTGADAMTTGSVPMAGGAPIPPGTIAGSGGNGGGYQTQTGYDIANGAPAGQGGNLNAQTYSGAADDSGRYALAPVGGYGSRAVESRLLPPAGDGAASGSDIQQSQVALAPANTASVNGSVGVADRPRGWSTEGAPRVTLQANETLYSVARRYGVPTDEVMKANGITDPTSVAVGQQLIIPGYSRGGGQQTANAAGSLNRETAAAGGEARPGTYTVEAGDTLSGISRKTGVSVSTLRSANGLSGDTIRVGQSLDLGSASGQQPVAVASAPVTTANDATRSQQTASADQRQAPQNQVGKVEAASAQPSQTTPAGYTAPATETSEATSVEAAADSEQASIAPESTGIGKLRWPVHGRILTAFGAQDGDVRNDGIDISVPEGSEIKSAENGVVIYAGSGLKEYGNTVLVRHDNGLVTVYGHASELKVSRGDQVRRGQVVALSGMSGEARQPKLHFEVRDNATPVDPISHLE